MREYHYTADAEDGSHNSVGGKVTAADRQDAEKKIRALYSYPVKIKFAEDIIKAAKIDAHRVR